MYITCIVLDALKQVFKPWSGQVINGRIDSWCFLG